MELTLNPTFDYSRGAIPLSRAWKPKQASGAKEWLQLNERRTGRKYFVKAPIAAPIVHRHISSIDNATEQIFEGLRQKWEAETAFDSSATKASMHPAYQRIIGMGPDVLPLILRDLRDHHAHWFWALQAITGDNPAQGESTVEGSANAWVQWGRDRGLI